MTRLRCRRLLLVLALSTSGCGTKVREPAPEEPAAIESTAPAEKTGRTAAVLTYQVEAFHGPYQD